MLPLTPEERVKAVLARPEAGGSVTVRGWLKTARHAKGISFLEVSDGSSFSGIQAIAEPSLSNYESEVKHLQAGYAVEVQGELIESPGKEQRFEIRARRLVVVGGVGADYPLQKKRHSFEFLRTIAHLRTAHQHVRRGDARAQRGGARDPRASSRSRGFV